jgi:hypothetical protein
MIIGAIIEIGPENDPGHTDKNGAALIQFYTMLDAVNWAVLQSTNSPILGEDLSCLCTVIDTEAQTKRWWYNGTEYTG